MEGYSNAASDNKLTELTTVRPAVMLSYHMNSATVFTITFTEGI